MMNHETRGQKISGGGIHRCICIWLCSYFFIHSSILLKIKGPIHSIHSIHYSRNQIQTGRIRERNVMMTPAHRKRESCVWTQLWLEIDLSPFVPGVLCPHHPSSRASIFPAFWRNSSYWMETKEKRETKVNYDDDSTQKVTPFLVLMSYYYYYTLCTTDNSSMYAAQRFPQGQDK
jgi:hypothetical protein